MSKKNPFQTAIESAMKRAANPNRGKRNKKIAGFVKAYKTEAWKKAPNYNFMQDLTKQIKNMKMGKVKKW